MAVKIGSARIAENGKATGGKAGDQTGNEVGTQNYYVHSKGWRVFRANDPIVAEKIAVAMEHACANNKIGYDQNERNTLFDQVKDKGYDPALAKTACETDCSALVRVCMHFAGVKVGDFITSTEASKILSTHAFTELIGDKYTKKSTYLSRGDILVTKTKGHTVVVLSNGEKAEQIPFVMVYSLGDREIHPGMSGEDVKEMQTNLIELGYDCGPWGADGDYGDQTEMALRRFQSDSKIVVDAICGPETIGKLEEALKKIKTAGTTVMISGGNCYVRTAPSIKGDKIAVAKSGNMYMATGKVSDEGWVEIVYGLVTGWVSGKYAHFA